MNAKKWSFYRESDGLFLSKRVSTNSMTTLARDTPPECIAIEGHYDRFSQRVDIATGELIEDQSLGIERDRERRINAAKLDLAEVDRKQHRRVREILAANDPQLASLEEEAKAARARLSAIDDETDTSEP
jgi:hypothetical protein